MNIILGPPTAQNLELTVSNEVLATRSSICQSCEMYIPSGNVPTEIINAVTGNPEIVNVYRYETCRMGNLSLTEFLTLKASVCPLGKW